MLNRVKNYFDDEPSEENPIIEQRPSPKKHTSEWIVVVKHYNIKQEMDPSQNFFVYESNNPLIQNMELLNVKPGTYSDEYKVRNVNDMMELFNKNPLPFIKITCFATGIISVTGILLGKLLNRIIIAPDIGVLCLLLSVIFFIMATLGVKNKQ